LSPNSQIVLRFTFNHSDFCNHSTNQPFPKKLNESNLAALFEKQKENLTDFWFLFLFFSRDRGGPVFSDPARQRNARRLTGEWLCKFYDTRVS